MTFLPIVDRELRVAARRKSTFVIRGVVALLAMGMAAIGLLVAVMNPRAGGKYVFNLISYYVFIAALLGGIFLGSDCLSRERREGTLGFLFLTDLKGHDVVLGKFMGVSLDAFYGLLAVVPVLGLSLLAGGVTGPEFARMSLALMNTLFFSIAASILVSSRSVSSYRTMASSFCLLIGLVAVTVIAHTCRPLVPAGYSNILFWLSTPSPAGPFLLADDAAYLHAGRDFWVTLAVSHLLAWTFLGAACWRLPNLIASEERSGFWRGLFSGNMVFGKSRRRAALLEINPVWWLADDSRRLRWLTWGVAVTGAVLLLAFGRKGPMAVILNMYIAMPFYFVLKIFFAIQSCRLFGEARRSGSIELLYATPLTTRTVLRGQWLALRQIFLWPVIVLLAAQIAGLLWSNLSEVAGSAGSILFPIQLLFQFGKTALDFYALGWFGMWMALTNKKPDMVEGLTILFVLVLPVFAFCVPTFAIDIVFIVVARSKLQRDFRRVSPVFA